MCLTRAPASANHPTRHTFLMLLMKWFCNNFAFKVKIIEHIFMTSCPPGVSLSMDIVPPKNLQLISRGFHSQLNQQTANAEKSARLILHVACWTTKKKESKNNRWQMSNDAEIEIELEKRKESNSTPSNSPQAFLAPSTHASVSERNLCAQKWDSRWSPTKTWNNLSSKA